MADEETQQQDNQPETGQGSDPSGDDTEDTPRQLPEDHPLVKALESVKEERNELRDKVQGFEDAQKSEVERLQDNAAELQQRAETAEQQNMRLRVALDKGLTLTQAKRLVGDTEEEMAADADELLESFQPEDTDEVPRTPRERLRSGATATSEPSDDDPLLRDLKSKIGIR